MKVAISSEGPGLESLVDPRFGRAGGFVIVDMDTMQEKGSPFVTVDTVGAGEGEIVMWAGGSSSRQTDITTGKPVDSSIVGIVDYVDVLGKRKYDKFRAENEQ